MHQVSLGSLVTLQGPAAQYVVLPFDRVRLGPIQVALSLWNQQSVQSKVESLVWKSLPFIPCTPCLILQALGSFAPLTHESFLKLVACRLS